MTAADRPDIAVRVPVALLYHQDAKPIDIRVYAILVDRQGENATAWPGLRRLAKDAGAGTSTALESVGRLERLGFLEIQRPGGNPGGQTNHYRVQECPVSGTFGERDVPDTKQSSLWANPERSGSGTERTPSKRSPRKNKGGPPDTVTHDAIQVWMDVYRQARGVAPDKLTPKDIGLARHLICQLAAGDLDELRRRLELAAGFNGQQPPFPFNRPGELTLGSVVTAWGRLGDALRCENSGSEGRGRGRPRATAKLQEIVPPKVLNA